MRRRSLGSLAVLLLVPGCASTGPSGRQAVPVISDPPGAVASAGDQSITTPGQLLVPPGARVMEVRVEKEGYERAIVILTPDSSQFRDCFAGGVSPDNPNPPQPPVVGDAGLMIGARLLAIILGCSQNLGQLQPTLVFVRLVPLPPLPVAPPRFP